MMGRFVVGWHHVLDKDADDVAFEDQTFDNLAVAVQHAKGVALLNRKERVFVLDDEAVSGEAVIRWATDGI